MSTEPPEPLVALNRLFVEALLALAATGESDRACRIAARGWSVLRTVNTREAERLTAALHTLVRPPRDGQRATKESTMPEDVILDVRDRIPAERHRAIFETYGKLSKGQKFILVNDHDPKPLYYQFDAEHHGEFSWRYLEQGPEKWRVEIGRPDPAHRGVR